MRRSEPGERDRLSLLFAELCRIPSPFRQERACAQRVAGLLADLGNEVREDQAAVRCGAQCGNLLARVSGRAGSERPGVLLCAHLDTVALAAPVEPVLVDDAWENAHDAILGADNKAAVAVLLALARRFAGDGVPAEPPPVDVELLFTVCEEDGLAGAKAFDVTQLRSRFGYVFDHATPIGEIVLASPTYYRLRAAFRGQAAHAGIRPEAGRNAIAAAAHAVDRMPLGRLDAQTTTNVGSIRGGSASANVVPDHCELEAEARAVAPERAEEVVNALVDALHDGANAHECDVDATVEQRFRGYRTRPSAPAVRAAESALRACGLQPRHITTGGGSDANAFQAAGFPCVNLANGTERNHEPTERVRVAALGEMLDVSLALLDAVAEQG